MTGDAGRALSGGAARAGLCGLTLAAAFVLGGCAAFPAEDAGPTGSPPPASERGAHGVAADVALEMLGAPYRYGGESPRGFDCSGLVWYSFERAGRQVPRTTEGLRAHSYPVSAAALRRGDLVFFDFGRRKPSHVGIYLGDRTFVHAPSSGGVVSRASLEDDFWKRRFVGAGRL